MRHQRPSEQRVAICSSYRLSYLMRADLTRKKNLRCEEVESSRSLAVRRSAARQGGSLLARRLTAQPPAPSLSLEDTTWVLPFLLYRLWAAQYSLRMRATIRALEP